MHTLTDDTAHKDKICIQTTLSVQTLHQRHTCFFKHSPGHREDSPSNMNHHDTGDTGLPNVSNPTLELISKTAQRQLKCKQPKDDIKCPRGQTVSIPCLTLILKSASINIYEAPPTSLQWIKEGSIWLSLLSW